MTRSFRGVRLIRFGEFALDVRAAELHKNGLRVRLQEQPFRILTMLLERPGEVVLRDELRKRLWPNGTIVEVGHGINAAVLRLRDALGDSAENPQYVETLARRGYRFIGALQVEYKERSSAPPALSEPAPERPKSTPPALDTGDLGGQTIAHYQVLEKLGGGGMGVVYRAADLRLGRQVALKFLPPDMASDPVALGRFQREARAASALNHPNICTIYGVEEHLGLPLIVMEYLEGETLEARLSQGALPVPKALALAIRIADALDAAHRKGIVHRDLKPGNVLLARSGVKVLDFGLAKMEHAVAWDQDPGTHVTQEGAILGTLHYMSPEQVQGKDADACSDIFSFGLVLYEMLAGRRAFSGENSASVMAAILTWQPPDLREPIAPAGLDRVLERCLAKDPEDRWQSARDLKAALEWVAAGWSPGVPAIPAPVAPPAMPPPTPEPASGKLPARPRWSIVAAVIVFGTLAFTVYSWLEKENSRPPASAFVPLPVPAPAEPDRARITPVSSVRLPAALPVPSHFTVWGPNQTDITRVSLSPDGREMAFVAGGRLYLRKLDSTETREVEGLTGAGSPFWSPDSKFVAVMAGNHLQTIDAATRNVTELSAINTNLGGTWGPDGSILIGQIGDGLFRIPAAGGVATRLTNLDPSKQETRHLTPQFLPDGRHYLFVAGTTKSGNTLYVGSLDDSQAQPIMKAPSNVQYVASRQHRVPGYLVYGREGLLIAQSFDPAKRVILGQPVILGGPVTTTPTLGASLVVSEFSVTPDALAYRSLTNLEGNTGKPITMQGNQRVAVPRPARVNTITVVRNWTADLQR